MTSRLVRHQPARRAGAFCLTRLRLSAWLSALCVLLAGAAAARAADQPAPDLQAGKAAFDQYCARCHGVQARGDGIDAKRFYPRPRDLTQGKYKFRSTVSGTPPTDEDLFRTITQGLPGSNMPDWQHLDPAVRWQLVHYLKSLSPVFTDIQPELVGVTADPGPKRADLAKGQQLYQEMGCGACHGANGRANGTSAAGLVDEWGMKIRPADLTQGWAYRGGSDAASIMMRLRAGIDGSGMPSYADAISPEDSWHLAYYVHALQDPAHWNRIARALRVDGAAPETAADAVWTKADATTIALRNAVSATGEWEQPPTVRAATVQTVYTADAVVFHVWWDDPTQDAAAGAFDAAAIVLRPQGVDGDIVTMQVWPYKDAPPLDLCFWAADAGQAYEAITSAYEPVLARTTPQALVTSAATYEEGRWHLVLQRPLQRTTPEGAASLQPGRFAAIAVVIWDGSNPGVRAVSPWMDVDFGGTAPVQGAH